MVSQRAKSTLEQWRTLQAVVDHGGYAQASAVLNKSQSSLNHAVAKLQQQLGIQLLEIKGRKAFLTDQGKVLLRRSRLVTQGIEELEQMADNIVLGWEPEITISTEIIYPKQALYNALENFYPQSRGTRIRIIDEVLTGTKDRILDKTADLVVAALPPKGFQGDLLEQVTLICYCGSGHPLANHTQVELKELESELQIVISDTGNEPEENSGWLKAEQRWTVTNFNQALDILRRDTGFCWVPKHMAAPFVETGEIVEVPLCEAKTRKIYTRLIAPSESKLGPAAQLLRKLILEQYEES